MNNPDTGSTFYFTAKLKKQKTALIEMTEEPLSGRDAEKIIQEKYKGSRVLVVDDDIMNQQIALMQLEDVGLVPDVADNGEEALQMVQENHYSLVLMDMQMPVMNGIDATRKIRELITDYTKNLPIIAMTGNTYEDDKNACLAAGMTDFLTKPFDSAALYEKVLRGFET